MAKVAKFEKVSFDRFAEDWIPLFPYAGDAKEIYDAIKLPKRATTGSAGYDFYIPAGLTIPKGASITIPTGIRCKMAQGWVLAIFPRSGLGFKNRVRLDNTVGIIDSDYYNSSNEGHIMIRLSSESYSSMGEVALAAGKGFVQGIFLPFGVTVDDDADGIRDGGFGSSDKENEE